MLGASDAQNITHPFVAGRGCAPRILHIGNIANNAYHNAKILNKAGFDCDVICYDYYHIMGCPEWEDADFEGDIEDLFHPDWTKVNLKGFKRPRWFVQGPFLDCVDYLIARRKGNSKEAKHLWRKLAVFNRTATRGKYRAPWLLSTIKSLATGRDISSKVAFSCESGKIGSFVKNETGRIASAIVLLSLAFILRVISFQSVRENYEEDDHYGELVDTLIKLFASKFPSRPDKLMKSDFTGYASSLFSWRDLLSRYDLVIAYSTDPIAPLLANKRPYIAYEHGTIRDIPFENTATGRLTTMAYAEADMVFLTNADSIKQADILRARKVTYGLHGFDQNRLLHLIDRAKRLGKDPQFHFGDGIKTFFSPARQHWKEGFSTWRKGNHLTVQAAAMMAKRFPREFRVFFVEWGEEVELTKKLIDELGVSEYFIWIKPLNKMQLLRAYYSADCVIDQFVLQCIGSITFEAIAVGNAPVITILDDDAMAAFYGRTIPLFNCKSADDICRAMTTVIKDSHKARTIAEESKRWFSECHNEKILKDRLVHAITECLTK